MLALEPAGAAAEREAGDPGRGDAAAGRGEPVGLRGAVELRPRGAAAHSRRPALRVDRDLVHRAGVDHEPALRQRHAGHRVPAAAHGDLEPLVAGVAQRRGDVVGRGAVGDQPRPLADHGVEERAGVLIGRIAGLREPAAQAEAQLVGGGLLDAGHRGSSGLRSGTTATLREGGRPVFAGPGHLARVAGIGHVGLRAGRHGSRRRRRRRGTGAAAWRGRWRRDGARCGG